ncbi:hypothetical protein HanPSC8_Chr09g0364491 [Helianthus annuus]|nr:hypothetical protein HanPSC8_Chr09g0364491 [Helianthus annuus]
MWIEMHSLILVAKNQKAFIKTPRDATGMSFAELALGFEEKME